ncbi:hypothetical protein EZS27_006054 [termite gut metagenome]|uniref:Uncharacterized protein n=1 Tax=termite gut metagenome TaxID=433724 RepID=A0A5J4SJJ7_9ZZZZ
MDKDVSNSLKALHENSKVLAEKRFAYHQYLLVPASTLFGILISLHSNDLGTLYTRLFFSLSIAALVCGILSNAMALYSHIDAVNRTRKVATQESLDAYRENRAMNPVSVPSRKLFVVCEKATYICYALGVVLLSLYTIFMTWS